jgi:hypothetical protein
MECIYVYISISTKSKKKRKSQISPTANFEENKKIENKNLGRKSPYIISKNHLYTVPEAPLEVNIANSCHHSLARLVNIVLPKDALFHAGYGRGQYFLELHRWSVHLAYL